VTTEHVITKKAADGTLSIAELRQFLEEFDKAAGPAHSLTATDGTDVILGYHNLKPTVRASFSGGIKSITVTVPGGDEKR
jgi:hypothetical protein